MIYVTYEHSAVADSETDREGVEGCRSCSLDYEEEACIERPI